MKVLSTRYTSPLRPFGLLGMVLALGSPAVRAQSTADPQAVHVLCIAEDTKAFDDVVTLADLLTQFTELSTFIDLKTGNPTRGKSRLKDFQDLMRMHVWPLQGLQARSLGTGFVVGNDGKAVLTSFDIAKNCPLYSGGDRTSRMQIAVLSEDGLRPIRATALGINTVFKEGSERSAPLPKFICKERDSECSRARFEDVHKSQLKNGMALARHSDQVKFWVPDLVLLETEEPLKVKPVTFRPDDKLPAGTSLRYSGFPRSQQVAKMGVSDTILSAERAKPTVQPATFSRDITIDTGADQIVAPDQRVKGTWFELSGASVERGNSGAPLYDPTTGQVVGMIVNDRSKPNAQDGGKAVPVSQIIEYLQQAKVGFNVAKELIPAPPPPGPAASEGTSAPKPPVPEPIRGGTPSWRERLMTAQSLVIATLVTIFVGIVAWIVLRQRAAGSDRVKPLDMNTKSGTSRPTKPEYFVTLRCVQGPLAPLDVLLPTSSGKESVTVGKDPNICQVVFPVKSEDISGVHCRFIYDKASHQLFVEDIQSTNGTFVNKKQLKKGERTRLQNGDVVALARPDSNVFVVAIQ